MYVLVGRLREAGLFLATNSTVGKEVETERNLPLVLISLSACLTPTKSDSRMKSYKFPTQQQAGTFPDDGLV